MRKARFTLSINKELSDKIDNFSESLGISKNAYISMVLSEKIKEEYLYQSILDSDEYHALLKKTFEDKLKDL